MTFASLSRPFLTAVAFGVIALCSTAEPDVSRRAPQADDECQLSIRAPAEVSWRGPYSRGYEPDHTSVHGERIAFEIRNTGGSCSYSVRIAPIADQYSLEGDGGELSFGLRSIEGSGAAGGKSPLEIPMGHQMPGAGKFAQFMIDIEPNQNVASGRYTQDLEILVYQETDGIPVLSDTRRMTIATEVWPKVSASIGMNALSGRNQAQVDLGLLHEGKRKDLGFSVRANTSYEVKIHSDNEGYLKHFRSDARIPYFLFLDGVEIDPSALGGEGVVSSGNTSQSHDFQFKIFEMPTDIPAGYYEDRLTVTITGG